MAHDSHYRAVLTIVEGPLEGQQYEITDNTLTLGTSGQILLKDRKMAPVHATIFILDSKFYIRRNDKDYPLYINGRGVDEEILSSMDEIVMGVTKIIFTTTEKDSLNSIMADYNSVEIQDLRDESLPELKKEPSQTGGQDYKTRKMESKEASRESWDRNQKELSFNIYLEILQGPIETKSHVFNLPIVVIGRTIGDLIIPDPDISRKHCSIETQSRDRVFLHDHASTNGTKLNGNAVSFSLLKSGDKINIGNTIIQIKFRSPLQSQEDE